MKRYKIVECTTNYGRKFYAIKYTVTFLWIFTFWRFYCELFKNIPIEFDNIKSAEKEIQVITKQERIKHEKVVSCTSIK